jgi:NAD(P)-dependent dehydrogenase (short-subunit alcohol dehydrogenase family)
MSARLQGKVAIVTGAGSDERGVGTGQAITTAFAREGARVGLVDLDPARAEATRAAIRSEGFDTVCAIGDVTADADCNRIVEECTAALGPLDILVNNVGIIGGGPLDQLDPASWDRVLAVNLTSAALMTKAALPHLTDHGGGAIVNIASIAALTSGTGGSAYGASKAGLVRLTVDTAITYGRAGVRANSIAPGFLFTPMAAAGFPSEEWRAVRRAVQPLDLEGTAWDIAWAAVYLASDEARFVTAVCLPVDGGVVEASPLAVYRYLQGA